MTAYLVLAHPVRRGIGAAIARLAGQKGYAVALNFNCGEAEARKVVTEIADAAGRALAIPADVSREDQILSLFQTAERELGPITALVNNAGVTGGFARVENVTADAIEKAFAVNVTGAILCAREAIRRMSTRPRRRTSRRRNREYLFNCSAHGSSRANGSTMPPPRARSSTLR